MKISVIILAAGKGKRMCSSIPKVLHKVGGKSLLQHVVDAAQHGIKADSIYVVYGHEGDRIRQELNHLQVTWVEQTKQLGTAHAVSQPLNQIPDEHLVIVLYGDVPLISVQTVGTLVSATPSNGMSLLVAHVDDPTGLGRIMRSENRLFMGIIEEKDASDDQRRIQEVFSGIMAIPAALLKQYLQQVKNDNAQQEYYLTDVPSIALAAGTTVTTITAARPDEVLGINDKIQLSKLERCYQQQQAERLMLAGAIIRDPYRIDIRGEVEVGQDTVLDINVVMQGTVTIGRNCYIGPNVVLTDCHIGDDVRIKANSVIEKATVANECIVGPFARLRPGAQLEQRVRVGNFVEIKQSQLGAGTKVSHLTYLGDSTLGQNVNVGAGTITCNFDGKDKHPTVIGEDVFIGSNTALVAPITIGAGATIGAGSTVTEDAPDGTLILGRSRQTVVTDWQRPRRAKEE